MGGDGERGGDGGGRGNGGGCWIVSWTLRFAFSSINHRMFASCCCLETSKSASIFFRNYSICSRISHIVDVLACVEHADELRLPLLVGTILQSKKIFPQPHGGCQMFLLSSDRAA